MHSWRSPDVPTLPGVGSEPRLFNQATGQIEQTAVGADARAGLYVCGITPYDATHLGHASTYLAFDTLNRLWLDAGFTLNYAQNITDIDDPLLERAAATGVDWRELAASQIELFRGDMQALRILAPQNYVAVTEVIDEIAAAVAELLHLGFAYTVPTPDASNPGDSDVYFDAARAAADTSWHLGFESRYDRDTMLEVFAQRGGDPERPGKHDALDPLLWRVARAGEPSWPTDGAADLDDEATAAAAAAAASANSSNRPVSSSADVGVTAATGTLGWPAGIGAGRPGWHIECSVIALQHLGTDFAVQGGGSDLIFPHHEFSAAHATALTGEPFAGIHAHTGMVAYQGEKMSKSLGNLVLVSRLTAAGVDARVIRLALLAHHYRSDWEYSEADLERASTRLTAYTKASRTELDDAEAVTLLGRLRERLADDLDTPAALDELDAWFAARPLTPLVEGALDALLGIRLS
ncbi:class I tRNA ligase family protein [Subtercola lobariae]|uniref:L-cysteine:1D-myo-inositol 2-amino-2-deoxy-alpha-D-glucopyranoside ligase n=1 Tax=Subtercola lobariae TaxID=1588641 RepID=A0A917BCX0_9MICO|nr:class I tRNA ligase family protein [Subtercola lobariae]GGF32551.1 L-cysteine:1D-myo-inositol 2-amino-2-deoxy-alpha-D-glucopyranoside ligase [Subtercola lobariae]